jgi:acyl carrier protein
MNDELNQTILFKIKDQLAKYLGVNTEDITEEDTFFDDLHMQPSDFADFVEELSEKGFDTEDLDMATVSTVGELVEALSTHEYIS